MSAGVGLSIGVKRGRNAAEVEIHSCNYWL